MIAMNARKQCLLIRIEWNRIHNLLVHEVTQSTTPTLSIAVKDIIAVHREEVDLIDRMTARPPLSMMSPIEAIDIIAMDTMGTVRVSLRLPIELKRLEVSAVTVTCLIVMIGTEETAVMTSRAAEPDKDTARTMHIRVRIRPTGATKNMMPTLLEMMRTTIRRGMDTLDDTSTTDRAESSRTAATTTMTMVGNGRDMIRRRARGITTPIAIRDMEVKGNTESGVHQEAMESGISLPVTLRGHRLITQTTCGARNRSGQRVGRKRVS